MRHLGMEFVTGLLLLALANGASGADQREQDEQAIRAAAKQYLAALEKGDAQALTALWTADGDLIDEHGGVTPAKELIAQEAGRTNKGPRPDIKILANTIRFLSADVALEDGATEIARTNEGLPPLRGRFTAVWVKAEGRWRLASLREVGLRAANTPDDLADLDWMVGDWVGQTPAAGGAPAARLELKVHWNAKHTFLLRELQAVHDGKVLFSASQRIGWDPLTGSIRSWMFDSEGGHAEATWTQQGPLWVVQGAGVHFDGRRAVSTNYYTQTGPNSFTWKSIAGLSAGEPTPDTEITMTRVAVEAK